MCSCNMSRDSKSCLEQERKTSKIGVQVIGIGVKFPFLSYRASAKNDELDLSLYDKLKFLVDVLKKV